MLYIILSFSVPMNTRAREHLDFCHKNQTPELKLNYLDLKEIPKEVATFTWLTTLDLCNNRIEKLEHLPPGLQTLQIANNCLSKISTEEVPTGLKVLNLAFNRLSEIQPMALPSSLVELYLEDNILSNWGFLITLNQLEKCDLAHNPVENLDGMVPPKVEELNLTCADLKAFPQDLPMGLKELNVSYNPIQQIRSLPPHLEKLWAARMELEYLETPPDSLTTLEICHNSLKDLPMLPEGLKFLDASDNLLSTVEDLPKSLERVNLSKNELTERPKFPTACEVTILDNPFVTETKVPTGRVMGTGRRGMSNTNHQGYPSSTGVTHHQNRNTGHQKPFQQGPMGLGTKGNQGRVNCYFRSHTLDNPHLIEMHGETVV